MKLINKHKKVESNAHLPEGISIQPRQPDMDALSKTQKLWFGKNRPLTIFSNVFSLYIPRGELFFIRSVRHYKDDIKDPELKAMVVAFMQQEVLHAKAHDAFNESFKEHGFDVDGELERIYKLFDQIEKYVPKKIQLGMTVFLEHITATMAADAFTNETTAEIVDPEVLAFNQWHAAEELEHKNVAFDVLKEVGGGYFTRITSALLAPILIAPAIKDSMKRMAEVYNEPVTEENREQFRRLRPSQMEQLKTIRKYFIPKFHPWKQDDTGLLMGWYDNFKDGGDGSLLSDAVTVK